MKVIVDNPMDRSEFGCSVWLEGNDSMTITMDDEGKGQMEIAE